MPADPNEPTDLGPTGQTHRDEPIDDQAAQIATGGNPLADTPAEPGVSKPDPILTVDNVRKTFGGLVAVDVEHLEIQRGIITALIGPNGAGKTTFFNLMTGFDQPDQGTWVFDGKQVRRAQGHQMARRGMVRTFQLTKARMKMPVIENMKSDRPVK